MVADEDDTFRNMLGLIRGRLYYNLLNWYRVLALLPGFTVNRKFMEQMMGVRESLPESVKITVTSSAQRGKFLDALALARTLIGLLLNYLRLPRQIARFTDRLNDALAPPAIALSDQRPDELAGAYRDLRRKLLTRWDAPLVNDFFAMIFYGVLRQADRTLVRRHGRHAPERSRRRRRRHGERRTRAAHAGDGARRRHASRARGAVARGDGRGMTSVDARRDRQQR